MLVNARDYLLKILFSAYKRQRQTNAVSAINQSINQSSINQSLNHSISQSKLQNTSSQNWHVFTLLSELRFPSTTFHNFWQTYTTRNFNKMVILCGRLRRLSIRFQARFKFYDKTRRCIVHDKNWLTSSLKPTSATSKIRKAEQSTRYQQFMIERICRTKKFWVWRERVKQYRSECVQLGVSAEHVSTTGASDRQPPR